MRNAIHTMTFSSLALPAALTWCGPAHAHNGPHQLTYLQSLLHELAYADILPAALMLAAVGAAASWRLARRKAAGTSL
jgi:hypothetical protein